MPIGFLLAMIFFYGFVFEFDPGEGINAIQAMHLLRLLVPLCSAILAAAVVFFLFIRLDSPPKYRLYLHRDAG